MPSLRRLLHGFAVTPLVLLAACSHSQAPAPTANAAPPVPVLTVAEQVTPRDRVWDGTVQAVNRATLSAQTAGRGGRAAIRCQ